MKATKVQYKAMLPNGKIVTKSTSSKVFTHAVACLVDGEWMVPANGGAWATSIESAKQSNFFNIPRFEAKIVEVFV